MGCGSSGPREDSTTYFTCSLFSEVSIGINFKGSQWPRLHVFTVAVGTIKVFC